MKTTYQGIQAHVTLYIPSGDVTYVNVQLVECGDQYIIFETGGSRIRYSGSFLMVESLSAAQAE